VYYLRFQEPKRKSWHTYPLGISRKPIRSKVEASMSFTFSLHSLTLSIATALL
jgi:hypothetical protein